MFIIWAQHPEILREVEMNEWEFLKVKILCYVTGKTWHHFFLFIPTILANIQKPPYVLRPWFRSFRSVAKTISIQEWGSSKIDHGVMSGAVPFPHHPLSFQFDVTVAYANVRGWPIQSNTRRTQSARVISA